MALNLLGLAGICTALILWRRLQRFRREGDGASRAQAAQTETTFSGQLHSAALKQRLQEARHGCETSERYRFAAALANQGMPPERIGETLNLAAGEVAQVIALVRSRAPRGPRPA
jgi:hypothetical protein